MKAPTVIRHYTSLLVENPALVVIYVATTISMTGQGIVTPVIPIFAREFGVGAATIGLIVGIFGLARLLFNLPAGLFSQRFGRRILMGVGLLLNAIGLGLTGASGSVSHLILWRFLAGVGSAFFITGAMTFIADISTTNNRGRLMSLQQASLLLGVDIGPAIGGFVADAMGFRWPFYLAGILSAGAAFWVLLRLPETRNLSVIAPIIEGDSLDREPKASWDVHTIKTLLSNPTFVLVSLFTMLVFFTRSGSRHTLLPLIAVERLDISATQLGLLFTTMTTINLLFAVPSGAFTDRFGRKTAILPGTILSLLGLSMFALGTQLWIFYGAAVALGLGSGVIGPAPAAYAGDLAPPGKAGVTMGLYRSFGDPGFIIGPVLLGLIADAS